MANHFRDALEKLSPTEMSSLVAPLVGLLKLSGTEELDRSAVARFLERYEAALGAHGHRLEWVAPNGERFDGTMRTGHGERTRSSGEAPWRQLVFRVTGGEIGIPNQPEGALIDLADGSSTTLVRALAGDRAVLLWCWSAAAPPSAAELDRVAGFVDDHGDVVDVVGIGVGGKSSHAGVPTPAVARPGVVQLWDPTAQVGSALGVRPGSIVVVSPDLQRATDPFDVFDDGLREHLDDLIAAVSASRAGGGA